MIRVLIVSGLVLAIAGCRNQPVASRAELMNSEAVKALRADDSPYRIIYYPPVDLAKKPAAVTTGPASPHRE
jgi:hypothetical protein